MEETLNKSFSSIEVLDESPTDSKENISDVTDYKAQMFADGLEEFDWQFFKVCYNGLEDVKFVKSHCTSCDTHLGTAPYDEVKRYQHPLLKVLVCSKCFVFYSSGEYAKDADGSEIYCRWCGEGGQVFCCTQCPFVFCKKCIKRNLGYRTAATIENSACWLCFACDKRQIRKQRVICWALVKYSQYMIRKFGSNPQNKTLLNLDSSTCCMNKKRLLENNDKKQPVKKKKKVVTSKPKNKVVEIDDTWSSLLNSEPEDEVICTPDIFPTEETPIPSSVLEDLPPVSTLENIQENNIQPETQLQHQYQFQPQFQLLSPQMNQSNKNLLNVKGNLQSNIRQIVVPSTSTASLNNSYFQVFTNSLKLQNNSHLFRTPLKSNQVVTVPNVIQTIPSTSGMLRTALLRSQPVILRTLKSPNRVIAPTCEATPLSMRPSTSKVVIPEKNTDEPDWFEAALFDCAEVTKYISMKTAFVSKLNLRHNKTKTGMTYVYNFFHNFIETAIGKLQEMQDNMEDNFKSEIKLQSRNINNNWNNYQTNTIGTMKRFLPNNVSSEIDIASSSEDENMFISKNSNTFINNNDVINISDSDDDGDDDKNKQTNKTTLLKRKPTIKYIGMSKKVKQHKVTFHKVIPASKKSNTIKILPKATIQINEKDNKNTMTTKTCTNDDNVTTVQNSVNNDNFIKDNIVEDVSIGTIISTNDEKATNNSESVKDDNVFVIEDSTKNDTNLANEESAMNDVIAIEESSKDYTPAFENLDKNDDLVTKTKVNNVSSIENCVEENCASKVEKLTKDINTGESSKEEMNISLRGNNSDVIVEKVPEETNNISITEKSDSINENPEITSEKNNIEERTSKNDASAMKNKIMIKKEPKEIESISQEFLTQIMELQKKYQLGHLTIDNVINYFSCTVLVSNDYSATIESTIKKKDLVKSVTKWVKDLSSAKSDNVEEKESSQIVADKSPPAKKNKYHGINFLENFDLVPDYLEKMHKNNSSLSLPPMTPLQESDCEYENEINGAANEDKSIQIGNKVDTIMS